MGEDQGHQSWKANDVRRHMYTDIEASHDDFRNWYGERKKCGSEGTEKLINRSNIVTTREACD